MIVCCNNSLSAAIFVMAVLTTYTASSFSLVGSLAVKLLINWFLSFCDRFYNFCIRHITHRHKSFVEKPMGMDFGRIQPSIWSIGILNAEKSCRQRRPKLLIQMSVQSWTSRQEVIIVLSWRGGADSTWSDRVGRYLPVNIHKHMFFNSVNKCFVPRSSKHDDILLFYADKLHARINGENPICEFPNVFLNAACAHSTLDEEICPKCSTLTSQAVRNLSL